MCNEVRLEAFMLDFKYLYLSVGSKDGGEEKAWGVYEREYATHI